VYHGRARAANGPAEPEITMAITAGYDVGGAHLKIALAEDGRTIAAAQIPCPLWEGLDRLDAAIAHAAPFAARADAHAATMTGELCEIFADRAAGVAAIVDRLEALLGAHVRIWMGPRGFGTPDEARADPMSAASTNFLATAELVTRHYDEAVLIDMGSTTTDIIPVAGERLVPRALTDGERLATGELVYTGLTRTDVSAVARTVVFRGRKQRLAAGNFAAMADVRRILGELPDDVDQMETADRRGKSLEESLARFARCLGRDRRDAKLADWREAAVQIAAAQMEEIRTALLSASNLAGLAIDAPVIAAGVGAPQVFDLAERVGRRAHAFAESANALPECAEWATRCAPAVAIALLAGLA
jgi:(4-(4-[2-(gamma-L-glutamylamino)ethyl]phenoxymethyl)furan-2-yl)methanamine synthase